MQTMTKEDTSYVDATMRSVEERALAKNTFVVEQAMLNDGWRSMSKASDFRRLRPSTPGEEYTIAYLPGRKLLGKQSTMLFKQGRVETDSSAVNYVEVYQALEGPGGCYWAPVD